MKLLRRKPSNKKPPAEPDHSQLMTLINSISDAVLSITPNGTIRLYNAATLNLLDTNSDITGRNLDEVFSAHQNDKPVQLMPLLATTRHNTIRDDISHQYPDGEQIRLNISCSPIHSLGSLYKIEGFILVIRDITRAKSLEEERDEFISIVSHELRTPVTIVEGTLSNALLMHERGATTDQLLEQVKSAHEQTTFLANMINDLSTLSRAERGLGDEHETIDVTKFMHELFSQYEPKARARKLRLNLDVAAGVGKIYTSRLYLEEMLQNFLTNSIKYTRQGHITLSAHRHGQGIRFAVSDTGIGISKTDQQRVFDKFYRAEDYRARETSGSGLGLYVVKKLSHKLGTTVRLQSRLNHGSTFSFTILDQS